MSYDQEVGWGSEVGNWAANEKGLESLSLDLNRSLSHITQMSKMKKNLWCTLTGVLFVLAVTLLPVDSLIAQDEAEAVSDGEPAAAVLAAIDSGDTAWMIVATALVLFMTFPGLALFYGGLVRSKNILSILVQCFAVGCLMSILWLIYGYSLAANGDGNFFGDFGKMFLKGVGVE